MSKQQTILAIDVGNTNTVLAVFSGARLRAKWRISTDAARTEDEYAVLLQQLFSLQDLNLRDCEHAIISNVVPQTSFALSKLCRNYIGKAPLVVGEKGVSAGITIALPRPGEVGADRIVNASYAFHKYKKAAVIVDFGTATTFDVVNGNGEYIGGLIAPGVQLSLDALHSAAAKLPKVAISRPKKVIGSSTVEAMQAGVYYGYLGLVEGTLAKIKESLTEPCITIATGGLAKLMQEASPALEQLEEDLTLYGLQHIFEHNQSAAAG